MTLKRTALHVHVVHLLFFLKNETLAHVLEV